MASARPASCQPTAQSGEDCQLAVQRIWRIDNDKAATVEAVRIAGALDQELDAHELRHPERGQAGMKTGDRLRVLDRIPGEIDAGGEPFQPAR